LARVAIEREGSFYLTYHRWAGSAELRRAYPRLDDFHDAKLEYDPTERSCSDWYATTLGSLGRRSASETPRASG